MDPFAQRQKDRGEKPTVQIDGDEVVVTEALRVDIMAQVVAAKDSDDRARLDALLYQIVEALST